MCLILIAWQVNPEYPCVIAANRDEFHDRHARAAHWWPDRPHILAGKDLTGGGTWLGVTRRGRLAALTNYRDPRRRQSEAPSRGVLVTDVLELNSSIGEGIDYLSKVGSSYNGFNMVLSDGRQLGVYESVPGEGRLLGPGIYGLSNHLLDSPWPKVVNAKSSLLAALTSTVDEQSLLALLRDDEPAADKDLPDTHVSLDWERLLSSAFVRSPDYGTRCSTVVRIDRHDHVWFDEWTWDPVGNEIGKTSLHFDLQRD